jgi:hypothetical protein
MRGCVVIKTSVGQYLRVIIVRQGQRLGPA